MTYYSYAYKQDVTYAAWDHTYKFGSRCRDRIFVRPLWHSAFWACIGYGKGPEALQFVGAACSPVRIMQLFTYLKNDNITLGLHFIVAHVDDCDCDPEWQKKDTNEWDVTATEQEVETYFIRK